MSRMFSYPARLDEEYNMMDQLHAKATLLHIFLWELPSQYSAQSHHYLSLSSPTQFLAVLRQIQEKIEEQLQNKKLLLLVNAVKKERPEDFLNF